METHNFIKDPKSCLPYIFSVNKMYILIRELADGQLYLLVSKRDKTDKVGDISYD